MEEKKEQNRQGHSSQSEELRQTGGQQNESASRSGTTDMDSEALKPGRTPATERAGVSTKRNVTGNDNDGQVGI